MTALALLQDRRAEDVPRHEVGRELHAFQLEAEDCSQRFGESRLSESGDAFEQDVTASENAGHDEAMEGVPPEKNAVELLDDRRGATTDRQQIVGPHKNRISHGDVLSKYR